MYLILLLLSVSGPPYTTSRCESPDSAKRASPQSLIWLMCRRAMPLKALQHCLTCSNSQRQPPHESSRSLRPDRQCLQASSSPITTLFPIVRAGRSSSQSALCASFAVRNHPRCTGGPRSRERVYRRAWPEWRLHFHHQEHRKS